MCRLFLGLLEDADFSEVFAVSYMPRDQLLEMLFKCDIHILSL